MRLLRCARNDGTKSHCEARRAEAIPLLWLTQVIDIPFQLAQAVRMDGAYYVYIMTNKKNTVLYTGITNDLIRRRA